MNDKFCGSCGNPNPMLAVEKMTVKRQIVFHAMSISIKTLLTVRFVELSKVGSE